MPSRKKLEIFCPHSKKIVPARGAPELIRQYYITMFS